MIKRVIVRQMLLELSSMVNEGSKKISVVKKPLRISCYDVTFSERASLSICPNITKLKS